jgi:hypothetical protein
VTVRSDENGLPRLSQVFSGRDYRTLLLIAVAVIVVADGLLFLLPASNPTAVEATLDEPAHLATAVIALAALGWWNRTPFAIAALIASVALDLDHLPGYFNASFLSHGTPRPYTHSLTTVVVVVVVALAVKGRWREALLGVAAGTLLHLFRDMGEPGQAGVALFWPVSDAGLRLPYAVYGSTMVVLVIVAAMRRRRRLA